jgi:hypothetical protein
MTHRTDELTRLLAGAADDLVERERVPGPDTSLLWRKGRRTTWLTRGAAAGLAAALVLVAGALVAVVRAAPVSVPSDGTSLTYPQLVSDLFTGRDHAAPGPVFGLVALPPVDHQGSTTGVIDRSGALTGLPRWPTPGTTADLDSLEDPGGALAPDGIHLLIREGIVDLTDGTLTRPLLVDGVSQVAIGSRAVWSPDSRHVALGTFEGPFVLDHFADVVLGPAPGDRGVMLAGWRDDATVLGLRSPSTTAGAAFDIIARGLADPGWTTVTTISADAVKVADAAGQVSPSAVFTSPDGSRLLLVDRGGHSVLVDTTTGQRVAFAGAASASTDVPWDGCAPVWQDDQPLRASGGLRRPGDGAPVLTFADRVDAGCVTLAGNELTGIAGPGRATAERVWSAFLPVFWVLLLVGVVSLIVWMVLALRRSRKHGEDFLPMILGRLF